MIDKYKVLLLDIGDTLVHITEPFESYTSQALSNIFPLFNIDIDEKIFIKTSLTIRNELRSQAHESLLEPSIYDFFKLLEEEFSSKLKDYNTTEIAYIDAELNITKVFPESLQFLKNYKEKNYTIIAATNNFSPQHVKLVLDKFDLLQYFDNLFISGEEGIRKPNKLFLDKLIEKYNLRKRECIMIGDKDNMDIMSANLSGIDNVWINRKNKNKKGDYNYDIIIKSLSELN